MQVHINKYPGDDMWTENGVLLVAKFLEVQDLCGSKCGKTDCVNFRDQIQ